MNEKLAFSKRFIAALEYANLSHLSNAKLGKLFDVSGTTIFGYRNAEKVPSVAKMISVANHCRVSMLWLAQGYGPMALDDSGLPAQVVNEDTSHYSIKDKAPMEILRSLIEKLDGYLSPTEVMEIVADMISSRVHQQDAKSIEAFWSQRLGIGKKR